MGGEKISFETRDEFQRKPIADKVLHLLASDIQVSPMIIDGDWGTGKTEFCQKLIHLIENSESKLKPIYIDAFKADHADEPLMTVLSAILKLLPKKERPPLMKAAIPVAKFSIKTGLKAGVSWVLKKDAADVADDFAKDLKSAGDQAINYAVESLLTEHVEAEGRIDTLKKALAKVSEDSSIVIFIDELDRCRPNFAVSMLESIKHIFDVENVQFVLVTNSNQLKASINHCYGDAVEAQRYLDKFIRFSFILPNSFRQNSHFPMPVSKAHLNRLINESDALRPDLIAGENLDFMWGLVKANNLSLREVETFAHYLEVFQILTNKRGFSGCAYGRIQLKLFGVFLFCFKPELAKQLEIGVVDAMAIVHVMGKTELHDISAKKGYERLDVVAAIIGFEATDNGDKFRAKGEEEEKIWKEEIHSFLGGGFAPDPGEEIGIIISAIEVLQLGGE